MPDLTRRMTAAFLLLLLTTSGFADEAVLLKNGRVLLGTVVSLSDTQLVLDIQHGKKTQRTEVATTAVQPTSLYDLKLRRISATDGKAQLALARWCMTHEIFYFAIKQFERAATLDPALAASAKAGLKQARLSRGKAFYERAVAALKARKFNEAQRLFNILIKHYAVPFAGPARSALAHIEQARLTAQNLKLAGKRPAARGQRKAAKTPKTSKALTEIARQARLWSQAAYGAKTDSRARRSFVSASKWNDRGLKILDGMLQSKKLDRPAYEQLRRSFVRGAVDQAIQIAVIYLRQDNEYGANKWLARALALDPNNERAKELRLFVITEWRDNFPWSVLGRRQR